MTDNIVKEIESGSVYADLMLASTPRAMLSRMEENTVLSEAVVSLSIHQSSIYLSRVHELFAVKPEDGYSHPFDCAIAAYAYLLSYVADVETHAFLRELATASCRSDLRFARSVARYVLEQAVTANNTAIASASADYTDVQEWSVKKGLEQSVTKKLPEEAAFLVFSFPKTYKQIGSYFH